MLEDFMLANPVFERFVEKSPMSVMVRGVAERVLNPELLNEWFDNTAESQYTRDLLFSSVFDLMSQVVCGTQKTVHSAYQASVEEIGVSITALYDKINRLEITTSAELVRYASAEVSAVIEELGGTRPALMPGMRVKLLDGNCIAASEHRLKELRSTGAGALPGKTLVVLDPALRIPIDVFPCEDGHAQERSLLEPVLESIQPSDLWIADRNFCTVSFLHGIAEREAYFAIRKHANLPYTPLKTMKRVGQIETGTVYEQMIEVSNSAGNVRKFRLIRVCLNNPTRDGETQIEIVTNVSKTKANGKTIANLYRKRWTIETAFQDLAQHLNSEINTLAYPPAAIFGFCVALVTYMMYAVVKAALSSVYGSETVDNEISGYYVADEISSTYKGMMIAIPNAEWIPFREIPRSQFVAILVVLAEKVNLRRFRKHPRGPKKKQPKRKYDPKHPHVSTARLLAARAKKKVK
jgi:IS4 transposase